MTALLPRNFSEQRKLRIHNGFRTNYKATFLWDSSSRYQ